MMGTVCIQRGFVAVTRNISDTACESLVTLLGRGNRPVNEVNSRMKEWVTIVHCRDNELPSAYKGEDDRLVQVWSWVDVACGELGRR